MTGVGAGVRGVGRVSGVGDGVGRGCISFGQGFSIEFKVNKVNNNANNVLQTA